MVICKISQLDAKYACGLLGSFENSPYVSLLQPRSVMGILLNCKYRELLTRCLVAK